MTVFPEFVLVSPQGTSSPSSKPGGGVPGGHVWGSARFHNDSILGSSPFCSDEPGLSCCFRLMTLCTGSSLARSSARLESPKKYVPSPEIVPAARIPEFSIYFMLASRKSLAMPTIRDTLNLVRIPPPSVFSRNINMKCRRVKRNDGRVCSRRIHSAPIPSIASILFCHCDSTDYHHIWHSRRLTIRRICQQLWVLVYWLPDG